VGELRDGTVLGRHRLIYVTMIDCMSGIFGGRPREHQYVVPLAGLDLRIGGSADLFANDAREADYAGQIFESLGIGKDRLIMERRSRNTYENAVFSKAIASPKQGERWLLITSAYHMPRAIGVFRAVGFAVDAYPVDWHTRGPVDAVKPFSSLSDGLGRTDTAVREWLGLVVYRLTGKTEELFPAP